MQGTAAAYDIARFGNPSRVLLVDSDLKRSSASAERVNSLVGNEICFASEVDAGDEASVAIQIHDSDVVLSCVPYRLHATVEHAALAAGTNVVDMGNDTDVTMEMLNLDSEFKAKGITLVPDTGLAPGLVNSIGAWMIGEMDEAEHIKLYCGGLPQNPRPPLNYTLRFSVEGLVGEYVDEAIAIRDHEVVRLETLRELENLDVPELGMMEAFTTSSGTSTAPYTFKDKVRHYEYKTLRYPGHCQIMQAFQAAGFWNDKQLNLGDEKVTPIQLFYRLMGDYLFDPTDPDLAVVHAVGTGVKAGKSIRLQVDVMDKRDPATGFTAMERMTGFSTAIMAIEVAQGRVRTGCVRYEEAVPGKRVMDELARRGIPVKVSIGS